MICWSSRRRSLLSRCWVRMSVMSHFMSQVVLVIYLLVIYVVLPSMMIWGWIRWTTHDKQRTVFSILSLIGFFLATSSALLAISSTLYANVIGGFPFYDPLLLRIYAWGALISAAGIVFASIGVWRQSLLRWHALICAVGTLIFGLWLPQLSKSSPTPN
jgi:hypothetical protein